MPARARNSGHLRKDSTDEASSSCSMANAGVVNTTWGGRPRRLRRPVGHMLCFLRPPGQQPRSDVNRGRNVD